MDFYTTILLGNSENSFAPGFICTSGVFSSSVESSSSAAVSNLYASIFQKRTRFSGPLVIGWNDKDIISQLSQNISFFPFSFLLGKYLIFVYSIGTSLREDWNNGGLGYKASAFNNKYHDKPAIFVSTIEDKDCTLEIYQDYKIKNRFVANSPNEVWEISKFIKQYKGIQLFGLENSFTRKFIQENSKPTCSPDNWHNFPLLKSVFDYNLKRRTLANLYPSEYEFSDRELRAWKTTLRAAGCHNITPWSSHESEWQFWTRSIDYKKDENLLYMLYKSGFLQTKPRHIPNQTLIFWDCFIRAMMINNKTPDGKRRILSIIADDFTYAELELQLGVSAHTILEARKHARFIGYGAPPLFKPIVQRVKLSEESLVQFEVFFSNKENVNMSSYKTDSETGLPVLYLQDTKALLWKKFSESFLNGMRRTSFMTRLQGNRYQYKEDLGGLCSTCNECGYEVFVEIEDLIDNYVSDIQLRKELKIQAQVLRRYLRRDFAKELNIDSSGCAKHSKCISHCLPHAFGECYLDHPDTCDNCESLLSFFDTLQNSLEQEQQEKLPAYQNRLIIFMAHHARKSYLNAQFNAQFSQLDSDGALIIVDYKMKILPKKARETKNEWFGKRGWTLHSVLVYTKNLENNNLEVQAFDDSTNGGHYRNTELMIIIGHWKEWYDISPRRWLFLEAGEAKTAIDWLPPCLQISHAIKRWVKIGHEIEEGEDIENAIKDLSGTHVSHLEPDRDKEKGKLGTINGISNWHEFTWPETGENTGYICTHALPEFGNWNKISHCQIDKITKSRTFEKPTPIYTTHTQPSKSWTVPSTSLKQNTQGDQEIQEVEEEQIEDMDIDPISKSAIVFGCGWALSENLKVNQKVPTKRIAEHVKGLLTIMFHSGTANPGSK
ncbi:uncharacterized protein OCT59_006153 [Rhizophagus irregularis]|nr:hypothetical protein OCT59_006153 [Rhizophagus irregularis]